MGGAARRAHTADSAEKTASRSVQRLVRAQCDRVPVLSRMCGTVGRRVGRGLVRRPVEFSDVDLSGAVQVAEHSHLPHILRRRGRAGLLYHRARMR